VLIPECGSTNGCDCPSAACEGCAWRSPHVVWHPSSRVQSPTPHLVTSVCVLIMLTKLLCLCFLFLDLTSRQETLTVGELATRIHSEVCQVEAHSGAVSLWMDGFILAPNLPATLIRDNDTVRSEDLPTHAIAFLGTDTLLTNPSWSFL